MDSREPHEAPTLVIGEEQRRLREKLRRELGPLICGLLSEPDVVEIMLNPDGQLWVERQGEHQKPIGHMPTSQAESAMATVASCLKTVINRDRPILSCELPLDGSRFQAMVPPVVVGPTFTIRRKAVRVFTLQDYVAGGIMTQAQRDAIEGAIRAKKNILVVGGTGTGKTTLTNAIIAAIVAINPEHRLVIIEDTGEIQCSAKNAVIMRAVDHVTMQDLLKSSMRMRPDRILVGEVRDGCALTLVNAWNTGHPGGAATIHSDVSAPNSAMLRMQTLMRQATSSGTFHDHEDLASAVNLIVSIDRVSKDLVPAGRQVKSVSEVLGWDAKQHVYLFNEIGGERADDTGLAAA